MNVPIHLSEHKSCFAVKIRSVPRFILGCCFFLAWAPDCRWRETEEARMMMIRPLATDAGDANEVNGQNEKPFATADDAADDANDEEEKEERSSDGSVKNPPIATLTVHTGLHSGLHTSLVKSI